MITLEELKQNINKEILENLKELLKKQLKHKQDYNTIKEKITKAYNANGIEKNKIKELILMTNNIDYIYGFYKSNSAIDDEEMCRLIIKENNPKYIYEFALNNSRKDLLKLLEVAILNTNNALYINEFAINNNDIDINLFSKKLVELKNPTFIYNFACLVKNAPLDYLSKGIAATNAANYIHMFAKQFENELSSESMDILNDEMLKCTSSEKIFNYAKNIKRLNLQKFEDRIIELNNPLYRAKFAFEIEKADRNKLLKIENYAKDNLISKSVDERKQFLEYLLQHLDLNDEESTIFLRVYYKSLNCNYNILEEKADELDNEYKSIINNKKNKVRKINK